MSVKSSNKLFLVSGHSGGGKTTIMRSLMDNEIISFTTREKRKGEKEGYDYKFITFEDFNELKVHNKLIESVEYGGNFYGVDHDEFNDKLNNNHTFCIVDFHGMQQMKEIYDNCCTIFIYNESPSIAEKQMKSRGDDEGKIANRLKTYEEEMANRKYYDYVIKNNHGQLESAIEIVRNIIKSEVSS